MIVYHGSHIAVIQPDTEHSRERVDFGKGFYVTPHYEQARKWCQKFIALKKEGIISKYLFDTTAYKKCRVLQFEGYSEQWLDFIIRCRTGKKVTRYDIIEGGVANDNVFNTIELFLADLIDKQEVIKRLKYEKPNWQICLKKQHVIDGYIQYIESEKL